LLRCTGLPLDKYEAVRYYQAASKAGISQAAERLNILKNEHPLLTAIITDTEGLCTINEHPLLTAIITDTEGLCTIN